MKADYASVNQQAGIFTGDEGYKVNVENHTNLKASLVTSTEQAETEGKNRFSTGTLTHQDLANHANHKGSAISVSGSASANFDTFLGNKGQAQSNKQATNDKGQKIYLDSNGKETTNTGTKDKPNQAKLATGMASLQTGLNVGFGYDKESASSITKAGINTQHIEIRNKEAQQELTGKSVEDTLQAVKTNTNIDNAERLSGKLENKFDKDKVLKELNIQVKVTKEFRQNAFSTIDTYVLPKQAELREQVKKAKTEEEKTALYDEIYKLQYQKRLLETVVGIVSGSPKVAITQGTLQLAATKMREETLANSRLFKGIKDEKTGQILRNDSYDSGYFDGVKLGGVRIDLDVICNSGMGTCTHNEDGTVSFIGTRDKTLNDAIDPAQNKKAEVLYGPTGGFQSIEGGWYSGGKALIPYKIGSFSDLLVESFAGTHDMLGGQI